MHNGLSTDLIPRSGARSEISFPTRIQRGIIRITGAQMRAVGVARTSEKFVEITHLAN